MSYFDPVSFLLGIAAGALITYLLALVSWYRMPRATRAHLNVVSEDAVRRTGDGPW